MKESMCIALVCLIVGSGCRKEAEFFGNIAKNPNNWVYITAREVRVLEPEPDATIRDQRLKLTDGQVLTYDMLNRATNDAVVLAMASEFRTSLVTSSVSQAEIPKNRGQVLPVVVDRKFKIHFLSQTNKRWLSTNVLRTRIVLLTSTLEQTPETLNPASNRQ